MIFVRFWIQSILNGWFQHFVLTIWIWTSNWEWIFQIKVHFNYHLVQNFSPSWSNRLSSKPRHPRYLNYNSLFGYHLVIFGNLPGLFGIFFFENNHRLGKKFPFGESKIKFSIKKQANNFFSEKIISVSARVRRTASRVSSKLSILNLPFKISYFLFGIILEYTSVEEIR